MGGSSVERRHLSWSPLYPLQLALCLPHRSPKTTARVHAGMNESVNKCMPSWWETSTRAASVNAYRVRSGRKNAANRETGGVISIQRSQSLPDGALVPDGMQDLGCQLPPSFNRCLSMDIFLGNPIFKYRSLSFFHVLSVFSWSYQREGTFLLYLSWVLVAGRRMKLT